MEVGVGVLYAHNFNTCSVAINHHAFNRIITEGLGRRMSGEINQL
jgi:hypothetical protein